MKKILILLFFSLLLVSFKEGERLFTIQVASCPTKTSAEKLLKKVKKFPYARITYSEEVKKFRIRVGFFKTYQEAKKFLRESGLKKYFPGAFITLTTYVVEKTTSSNRPKPEMIQAKKQKEPKQKEPETTNKQTTKPQPIQTQTQTQTSTPSKTSNSTKPEKSEKREPVVKVVPPLPPIVQNETLPVIKEKPTPSDSGSLPIFILGGLGIAGALFGTLFFFLRKKTPRTSSEEKDIENFVAELVEREEHSAIVEKLLPYVSKNPEDTFVKFAVAQSLEKLGRRLEAIEIYLEIAEILRKKGLEVLADELEKRAERLSEKAFE